MSGLKFLGLKNWKEGGVGRILWKLNELPLGTLAPFSGFLLQPNEQDWL